MALPAALSLKIEFLFSYLNTTPSIRITDETDYAAEGRTASNIRGVITVKNAAGLIAYQNLAFDAPDIDLSVGNVVTLLTSSSCCCGGGFIDWCDDFTITYSIKDVSNSNEFTKDFTNAICFTPFPAKLSWKLDCYTATLSSSDCTSYKQGGITPVMSDYAHTLTSLNKYPLDFEKIKTEFNFECGKETVASSEEGCEAKGSGTNGIVTPLTPLLVEVSNFPNVNQAKFSVVGDYKIQYSVPTTSTITTKKNNVVLDTKTVNGVGSFIITTVAGIDTLVVAPLVSFNGNFVATIYPPCLLSSAGSNSQGDAYSKCCNTLTLSYPELYSGLHKHAVSSDLTYDFGSNWFVIYTVNYCKEFEVECITDLCNISNAIYKKWLEYDRLLCINDIKAIGLGNKLFKATSLLALHEKLLRCGFEDKASNLVKHILTDLGISSSDCGGCGCGGSNCEPQKILPILNKDAYVAPQIMLLEGLGIDIRLDNVTDPHVNAYTLSAETSDVSDYEYLSMPFTSTNLITPMAFSAPFDASIQIDAIDANNILTLSYSKNFEAFIVINLGSFTPIPLPASAHVIWKATISPNANPELASGSIVLKYKIV